jgi:hypothetical protein
METLREGDSLMDAILLIDKTLATLKDFQKETVKSVVASFRAGGSERVLVADEVGLGKTIVAKGVIAELLKERLSNQPSGKKIAPLRVTYICSNLTLADENRKKLAVFHGVDQDKYVLQPSYGRLLDTAVKSSSEGSAGKILEICSLTPSTSFSVTRGHGYWRERMIIFAALIENPELYHHRTKLSNFFSDNVKHWSDSKKYFLDNEELDSKVVSEFHAHLRRKILAEEKDYCGIHLRNASWLDALLAYCRNELQLSGVNATRFRTYIRSLIAQACAGNLTADLFILDEFQRFKALLDSNEENEESLIAREIFSKKQTKALLLSATPFKAVSRSEDDEDGNAHAEELNYLLDFLTLSNQEFLLDYEQHRKALQQQILQLKDASYNLESIESDHKSAIEKLLEPYLCRTERAQISDGYENLFCSSVQDDVERIKDFSKHDIEVFKVLDQLGLALQKDHPGRSAAQLMEFYKASPWPLSFLSGYQFKKDLDANAQGSNTRKAINRSDAAWLSRNDIQFYKVNLGLAPQAKMRALVKRLFKTNSEELLWVPPSLPHYPLQGSFEHQQDFSKTLLFSSWAMVPRALSGLISYESERRLLLNRKGVKKAYFKDAKHSPTIKFDAKSSMVGWSLVYPSRSLIDISLQAGSVPLSELLKKRISIIDKKLSGLRGFQNGAKTGDRWYALAPMLLDKRGNNHDYLETWLDAQEHDIAKRKDNKGVTAQFNLLRGFIDDDNLTLGPMPEDLAAYLACLSIAGPAVSVYRALHNNWVAEDQVYAFSATEVAFAVISMFNKPEAESILGKQFPSLKYFNAIAMYCAEGGFQAVIDEYAHLLKGDGFSIGSKSDSATKRMVDVLSIVTSSVTCHFSEHKHKSSEMTLAKANQEQNKHSLRCHYAVPLGNQKITKDSAALQRVGSVRDTFNSPFRPFVLNSTSIGQEGLDFHWYCNQIVHWNLPSNPIDIEQREGRINRYKSLVVRRRLAENYKDKCPIENGDPWQQLFDLADTATRQQGRCSDLVPYWHLPEGTTKIERFVPMMPLSRDVFRLDHALKVLALYRLAFGQPRQEELLNNLLQREFNDEEIKIITQSLVINLSPMKNKKDDGIGFVE